MVRITKMNNFDTVNIALRSEVLGAEIDMCRLRLAFLK